MSLNRDKKNIVTYALVMTVLSLLLTAGCGRAAKKPVPANPNLPAERPVKQTGKEKWMEWGSTAFEKARNERKLILVCMSPWGDGYERCNEIMESTADRLGEQGKTGGFIPVFVDEDRRPDIYEAFNSSDCGENYSTPAYLMSPDGRINTNIVKESNIEHSRLNTSVSCTDGLCCKKHFGTDTTLKYRNRIPRMHYKVNIGANPDTGIFLDDIVTASNKIAKLDLENIRVDNGEVVALDYDEINMFYIWLSANKKSVNSRVLDIDYDLLDRLYDNEWGGVFSPRAYKQKYLIENARAVLISLSNHQSLRAEPTDDRNAEEILKYTIDFLGSAEGGFYGGQASDLQLSDGRKMKGKDFYSLKDEQRRKIGMPERNKAIFIQGNSEMVMALFKAADVLDRPDLKKRGIDTLDYLLRKGWSAERGAAHYIENGKAHLYELLNDDSALLAVLIDAYMESGENVYLKKAVRQAGFIDERFWDKSRNVYKYSFTSDPVLKKILEKKYDDEANMKMVMNLTNLFHITGDEKYKKKAEMILGAFTHYYRSDKNGGYVPAIFVEASYRQATHPLTISIVGPKSDPMTAALRHEARKFYEPLKVVMTLDPEEDAKRISELSYRARPKPTLYACVGTACSMPVQEPSLVEKQLRRFDDRFMGKNQYERTF